MKKIILAILSTILVVEVVYYYKIAYVSTYTFREIVGDKCDKVSYIIEDRDIENPRLVASDKKADNIIEGFRSKKYRIYHKNEVPSTSPCNYSCFDETGNLLFEIYNYGCGWLFIFQFPNGKYETFRTV